MKCSRKLNIRPVLDIDGKDRISGEGSGLFDIALSSVGMASFCQLFVKMPKGIPNPHMDMIIADLIQKAGSFQYIPNRTNHLGQIESNSSFFTVVNNFSHDLNGARIKIVD